MIDRSALRHAAVILAHDNPKCIVLDAPNGNVLFATCWCGYRGELIQLTEPLMPRVSDVRAWLGY